MGIGDDGKPHTLEFYEEGGHKPVLDWIKGDLTAAQRREIGAGMSEILQEHGSGVCGTEFGRWVDADIFYSRLRSEAGEIYRIYCHEYDGRIVLLLHGYNKGSRVAKSWEHEQIRTARTRYKAWNSARQMAAKAGRKAAVDERARGGLGPVTAKRVRR